MAAWRFAAMLLVPAAAHGACLTLAGRPDAAPLARIALVDDGEFAITYVHSVTRTPVRERYRVAGGELVETEMRFAQHGPGLPTQADPGGTFARDDGGFVVTMDRRFPEIVMRVHGDQSPRLEAAGRAVDLAQWGNRALVLRAAPGACPGPADADAGTTR